MWAPCNKARIGGVLFSSTAVSHSVCTFLIPYNPPPPSSPSLPLPSLPPPTPHTPCCWWHCNKSDTPKALVCLLCLVNVLYVNCNLQWFIHSKVLTSGVCVRDWVSSIILIRFRPPSSHYIHSTVKPITSLHALQQSYISRSNFHPPIWLFHAVQDFLQK